MLFGPQGIFLLQYHQWPLGKNWKQGCVGLLYPSLHNRFMVLTFTTQEDVVHILLDVQTQHQLKQQQLLGWREGLQLIYLASVALEDICIALSFTHLSSLVFVAQRL